jgi:hypothetical protein
MTRPARTRLVALVGALTGDRRVEHTTGYPLDPEKMLPVADVVLVVADDEAGAMLFRYTAHGEFGGDTWHPTLGDAYEQAAYEYGDALAAWVEVPEDVAEPHAFAIRYAYEHLNKRGDW